MLQVFITETMIFILTGPLNAEQPEHLFLRVEYLVLEAEHLILRFGYLVFRAEHLILRARTFGSSRRIF